MDKVWLYVGAIFVALFIVAVFTLSTVKNTAPTNTDLRAAYDQKK
ncbi:MAG: hypothetical protein OEY86_00345 [Nitrospira sp.]|nr:hypothetical protein [Nitrospira sp.]